MTVTRVLVLALVLPLCVCTNIDVSENATIAGLNNCSPRCNSTCTEKEAAGVCRCDGQCERYGDCCASKVACDGGEDGRPPLAGLECRSLHLDRYQTQPDKTNAVWMVSACPEDWLASQKDEELRNADEKCRNGSDNLPPVTDLDSGQVYRNEYCAVCRRVKNIRPWSYRLACSPWLRFMVTNTPQFNLTREIIERECIVCGFRTPRTVPQPPRRCLHRSLVTQECLLKEKLENITGTVLEENEYQQIVMRCHSNPASPVANGSSTTSPYRNQYCAICNGKPTSELVCADPYSSRDKRDYCSEEAASRHIDRTTPTTAPPPTTPTATTATTAPPPTDTNSTILSSAPQPNPFFFFDRTSIPLAKPAPEPIVVIPDVPFSIFLDVNGDSQVITSETVSVNITTSCSSRQVFDPIKKTCRQTICPEGYATQRGSCSIVQNITVAVGQNGTNESMVICDGKFIVLDKMEFELTSNDTLMFRNETYDIVGYNNSLPIICVEQNGTCDGKFIVLDKMEFELTSNDTLMFRNETYDIVGYNNSLPIICVPFEQNGTSLHNVTLLFYSYPKTFSILTYVGCSLSLVGCMVVLFTYALFKELRTLPGQILMNLASTILASCLFLLIGIPITAEVGKDELCEASAILLHWLMLSQFSWMSVMSFELARTLYRATKLRQIEKKTTRRNMLIIYLVIGWGIPTVITSISVVLNYTTDLIDYGEDGFCWIGHINSFYAVFLAPVVASIILNGVTFTVTVSLLFKASRVQSKLNKEQTRSYLRVYLSVFSITGLTWIFGFIAIAIREDWAWYAFVVTTTTQGFVICLAFIFTQKVGKLYKDLLFSSVSVKTTSKSNAKQSTQESSLPVKYNRKSENQSVASTLAQEEPGQERAGQNGASSGETGGKVEIEMDHISKSSITAQDKGNDN